MIALDTNILIYAAQTVADPRKLLATDVVARAALVDAVLPVQALAEFANACLRKGLLDREVMAQRISEWSGIFTTVAAAPDDVVDALMLMTRFGLAFYDSMLCVTVRRAGATTLLSEDMQDGMSLDGLNILNPFVPANRGAVAALLAG